MITIRNHYAKFKIYEQQEILKVYQQHAKKCGTVLYSEDGGYTWHSVPMDSGKWDRNWVFAFIK